MWPGSGGREYLEEAFNIRRFRRRTLVSFRRFVILNAQQANANALRPEDSTTQPLRVLHP